MLFKPHAYSRSLAILPFIDTNLSADNFNEGMAATSEEFAELIGGSEGKVDISLLRRSAFYGVPDDVRGEVWKILLPALSFTNAEEEQEGGDKAKKPLSGKRSQTREQQQDAEIIQEQRSPSTVTVTTTTTTTTKRRSNNATSEHSYSTADEDEIYSSARIASISSAYSKTGTQIVSLLRLEIEKYGLRNPEFGSTKMQARMAKILLSYVQQSPNVVSPDTVYVLAPFVRSMNNDNEASYCFELMLRALNFKSRGQKQTLGRFLMLFRSRLPELYTHFEEEDLGARDWAVSWLQWLLCKELNFECCLRLWDSYIAAPDGHGFELHTFVCLAILETLEAELIELEYPELVISLKCIPRLDMDRIINQAQYLARDFKSF